MPTARRARRQRYLSASASCSSGLGGLWRRLPFKLTGVAGGDTGMVRRTFLTTSLTALTTLRVAWNKHLMRCAGPDLGQDSRIHARIVGDHLGGHDAGCPE